MAFLNEEDYLSQIQDFDLDSLTNYTNGKRTDAELRAQAQRESYLSDRYNAGIIFQQTGNDRNPLVVMYMIDIALYHLFCTITPRMVPDIRIERYRDAMKWLDKVREGDINPNLPENTNKAGDKLIDSYFGSNIKNGYSW